MSCADMVIRPEKPDDAENISHLHDEAFGPGRFAKTAYRMREGHHPVGTLSLVALDGSRLVGAVRFSRAVIGGRKGALLLGPLAVFRDYSGHRCGLRLMKKGLQEAASQGFELVVLVGDLAYYQKAGFKQVPPGQILFPGPVDTGRILAFEPVAGSLKKFSGMLTIETAD